MAVVRKTVGTGITAREVTSYSGEDMAPAFDAFARNWNAARNEGGGDFGADVLYSERSCQRILEVFGPFKPDSVQDYAKRILLAIRQTKNFIAAQDAEMAARCGRTVGRLIAEAQMKFRWEPDALRGKKNASVLKGATARTNKKRSAEAKQQYAAWQAMADEIWKGKRHLTAKAVAERIEKRIGGKADTIRKKIIQK